MLDLSPGRPTGALTVGWVTPNEGPGTIGRFSSPYGDRITGRAGRSFEGHRCEDECELVDLVSRELFPVQVFEMVNEIPTRQGHHVTGR